MSDYVPPKYKESGFNCPFCEAFAHQNWYDCWGRSTFNNMEEFAQTDFCICSRCHRYSIWYGNQIVYPSSSTAPIANPDLPEDIKGDYEEARRILSGSPRGAAALLRLSIQKLCVNLGEKGDNLDQDIGNLVKKGLPPKIQQSLDIVRVIGNNAVHPGEIDLKDDTEMASTLFSLVNLITDVMITQPKHIEKLYQTLPEEQRKHISKRDGYKEI